MITLTVLYAIVKFLCYYNAVLCIYNYILEYNKIKKSKYAHR